MTWHATLDLRYQLAQGRTVVRHRHAGPLRVLKSMHPEDARICHSVLVHPPGGIASGDVLDISVEVESGAHALVTTPGATRFYRSAGAPGVQNVQLRLGEQARLEWLPLETLIYPGAHAENRLTLELAGGASLIGWDVVALGLPFAGQPFDRGYLLQRIEWPGLWLEHARIDGQDDRLLNSPLGLAGQRCLATLFYASAAPLTRAQREAALERTRAVIDAHALAAHAGVTALNDRLLVVRALAPVTEPASDLWRQIRAAWRAAFWQLPASEPRIWAM